MLCESAHVGPDKQILARLNPCCNGRCSASSQQCISAKIGLSLNPCCNGRCSASLKRLGYTEEEALVLILVVMEDALRVNRTMIN